MGEEVCALSGSDQGLVCRLMRLLGRGDVRGQMWLVQGQRAAAQHVRVRIFGQVRD